MSEADKLLECYEYIVTLGFDFERNSALDLVNCLKEFYFYYDEWVNTSD